MLLQRKGENSTTGCSSVLLENWTFPMHLYSKWTGGGGLFIRKCVRTNSLCVAWPGADWSSVWKGIVQCFFVRSRRNKIGTRDWRQFWITWLPFFHKSGYFFSFLKLPPPLLFPFFSCFLLEAWQVCLCFGFGKSSSSGLVVINSPFIFPFGLWALWW